MKHFGMAIQRYKGILKASFCIVLVIGIVVVFSIGEKKESNEDFLTQFLDSASGMLDEDTTEVWITCLEDFIHLKKEIGDHEYCILQESPSCTDEVGSKIGSVSRENIQKLISNSHPRLKDKFLHCLSEKNFPFHIPQEEDDSKTWYASYMEPFSSRRYLGHVLPRHLSEKEDGSSQKEKKKQSSQSSKIKYNRKAFYRTLAMTALVTFVAAALLFICFSRCCGSGKVRQTDERPLLSMSMSDYSSVGSSSHNNAGKFSIKEEKHGIQLSSNNLVYEKKNSLQESQDAGVASVAPRPSFDLKPPPGVAPRQSFDLKPPPGAAPRQSFDLKPPPGVAPRTSFDLKPPPGALPPLKPPPGRLDLLPPEPPTSEPSNNVTAPSPPPPPPRPPPSPRPPAPPAPPRPGSGAAPPPPPPKPGGGGPPPPPPPGLRGGPRPPPPPGPRGGPRAPPPPLKRGPRPPPPPFGSKVAKPLGGGQMAEENEDDSEDEAGAPKTKLKPFFWDKVSASDQTMVWNQLKAGSFQFNEEMMESLFGAAPAQKNNVLKKKESASNAPPKWIQIIDSKKAQNLSILLKALNVTLEEVSDALLEGNELPTEFLQTLLKMQPSQEEELKLRLFSGSLSQLGPADRFLKSLVEIPFAFKRMEALLYMGNLQEEVTTTRDSFTILEVACKELRSSRLFLKLLEAVLKTGNRMNDGTFRGKAQAFKLDTLLKLSDVKGVDGKTTLLHFVVQEIIRTEGIRSARASKGSQSFSSVKTEDLLEDISQESEEHYRDLGLCVVSRLSSELENVKKAAALDADNLSGTTARLGHGLIKTREFVNKDTNDEDHDRGFHETVTSFLEKAEVDVSSLLEEEKKILALVKSTGDYFHGNSGRDEGLRLFIIVRDFLIMLDKVCKEIQKAPKKPPPPAAAKTVKQDTPTSNKGSSSSEPRPPPPDIRQRLFPAIADRRVDDFSSDDESP